MGFSLTGSHVIFFVAAVIVSGAVSGVFLVVTTNISGSFSEKGKRVEEQLDTDFTFINDPQLIPLSNNNYLFYVKNIGAAHIPTSADTFQVFIDGVIIPNTNFSFTNVSIFSSEYTTLMVNATLIDAGYHSIRLVGPQAVDDTFTFKI